MEARNGSRMFFGWRGKAECRQWSEHRTARRGGAELVFVGLTPALNQT